MPGAIRRHGERFVHVYLAFNALSVVVLVALCVVLLLRVASVSERAAATAATSLKTCQAGNVSRQQSSDLWTGVLETPGSGIPKAALSLNASPRLKPGDF